MKEWLKKLFSNSPEVSCGRVMSVVNMFAGIGLAFLGLMQDKDLNALAVLVSVFIGGGVVGKVVQKFAETKKD